MFNLVTFLFSILVGLILLLVSEEILHLPAYSWPAVASASFLGLVTLRVSVAKMGPRTAWMIAGALVAVTTFIVRIGIVYGGVSSFLGSLNAFNIFGLLIVFAPCGALAGYILARTGSTNLFLQLICLAFVSFGVLFHLILERWGSFDFPISILLVAAELLAPAAFAFVANVFMQRALAEFRILFYNVSDAPSQSTVRAGRKEPSAHSSRLLKKSDQMEAREPFESYEPRSRSAATGDPRVGAPMSMRSLQARYSAARVRLHQRLGAAVAATGVNTTREAARLGELFGVLKKRRAAPEYADIAEHLLSQYSSEVAYFIATEIEEQFEPRLGYPPIGQIMVALEEKGGEGAARCIGCALRNFPRIETARLAFGVIKSATMRSLVRADLAAEDSELAEYFSAGVAGAPVPKPQPAPPEYSHPTAEHREQSLSDGIEQMPRRLTKAEKRGNRLFLHLQVLSFVVLVLLPILGGLLREWTGFAVGLVIGWLAHVGMRRSMGVRGRHEHEGFFIRMRERANGARVGFLEILIERVRQRPFTRAQCAAMTEAWDDTRRRLATTTSAEEKRVLMRELDAKIKLISYGKDNG